MMNERPQAGGRQKGGFGASVVINKNIMRVAGGKQAAAV